MEKIERSYDLVQQLSPPQGLWVVGVKVNIYSVKLMHWYNQNPTHDIIVDNFLYNWQTQHESNTKLGG
jgi:hypothetical protein